MYYDLIKHDLANLSAHTALLEACDWDEKELESVLYNVSDFLNNLKPDPSMSWNEFRTGIFLYFERIHGKIIANIIINILETKASEIKSYMEKGTND